MVIEEVMVKEMASVGESEREEGKMEEESASECKASKKTAIQQLLEDERGIGVIEIILILVILIGLVLLFKDQITSIVNSAFGKIASDATTILK